MSISPYVVGQWVRGEKFYGRTELVEEILRGNRNWLWLLGTRRIGKTSLLKQIEHVTTKSPELGYFGVFWDFQGSDTPKELHLSFGDSLFDAEERLQELGIALKEVEADDLFQSLTRLRRKLSSKGRRLLLLCDEAEELISLNQKDPSLLRKLRRAMQSQEDIRSILASTIRLWALADERGDTSPFLHGFTPPLYIHNLADDEARSLIHQANLPSESRPRFDDEASEAIRSRCDNHPYLIQLLCKRCLELDDLEEATEQVATDSMVSYFFAVDFEMLSANERDILKIIGDQDSSTSASIQRRLINDSSIVSGSLNRLQHLGYIRKTSDGEFVLANYFFKRWFREMPRSQPGVPDKADQATLSLTMNNDTPSIEEGTKFAGRYQILNRIGQGATGVVFKARDDLVGETIAIKILKSEFSEHGEMLERLRREVLLSRGITHPNVVKIYDLGDHQGRKYVTMQWVDGPTLADVIATDGPLPHDRTIGIATKLAAALEAAHKQKVLHRDIKPRNILVDDTGEPRITDFGLARLLGDPGMTGHGVFVGTPDYASPEQVELKTLDARSDIYALGVVLFEMATGRRPFAARSIGEVLEMHRATPAPEPTRIVPEIPHVLSGIIMRCLEKAPNRRFQSAEELRLALGAV